MGAVYAAHDARLQRTVAIKSVVKSSAPHPVNIRTSELVETFCQEATVYQSATRADLARNLDIFHARRVQSADDAFRADLSDPAG
jgi:serine/threonine protein kinase